MPNRLIRDGLLDSDKFSRLKDKEQMYFVRLMLIVDDYGRHDARPSLLKSKCYPVTDISQTHVRQMTDNLNQVGLINLYKVSDKGYLEIVKFNQRLRAKKSSV